MKHEIITIMAVLLCGLSIFPSSAQAKYGGGSGEPNDPFLIYTAEQMNAIGADSNDWDKCFKLMDDIDLGQYDGKDGREMFNIIGVVYDNPFNGVFDGNGHTILNFTYDSNDRDYIGLFGYVYGGDIKNLGLINPNVDAGTGECVGALVGWLYDGNITDCFVEGGGVKGYYYVGGLVGTVADLWGYGNTGAITNCYSTSTVSGYSCIGGLVGVNRGTINNCYSSRDVSGFRGIGGLTGANYGMVSCCYSNGDVEGDHEVGGLVGGNGGTITNSYANGGVSANGAVGGLVGRNGWYVPMLANDFGTISKCYSTGRIEGSPVGGLVGYNQYGEVLASFWDTETSGLNWSDGGTGKTTAEMQTMSTFTNAGWGCGSVWTIDEDNDYPRLWWENKPGEPIIKLSYCQGSGTEADPYLIYTAEQLNMIGLCSRDWDKCFKLIADIDLSSFTGTSFNIIGNKDYPFNGVFDGNRNTISKFSYTSTGKSHIGLFGYVGASGEIKNLGLVDANVSVDKGSIGGLVGYNEGIIRNSSVAGTVSGYAKVGGLVGYNYGGLIDQCCSSCWVSGSFDVGGLVGYTSGIVVNCYALGSVSGYHNIGGLIGSNRGMVTNCYATGSVSGSSGTGGLVGYNFSATIIHSFWDIDSTWQTSSSGGGEGKSTVEMQMANTFFAWGICGNEGIWRIDENNDYPCLAWELKPGQPIDNPELSEILQGKGTKDQPYLIYTRNELNTIGQYFCELDKHFKLMADIDLSGLTEGFNPIGTKFFPFGGIFDGCGHTISGFSVSGVFHVGLFGYVKGTTAEIRGLGLIQPEAYGKGEVGSLVGFFDSGSIKDCYAVNVKISGDFYIGGLVGLSGGRISNCYASGSVSGTSYRIGGLAGHNGSSGIIENCYANGSVISMIGSWGTGGLIGDNDGVISNCYAIGSVQGGDEVGGLVGENGYKSDSGAKIYGCISNSYSAGEVSGASYVGGFVGHHEFGSVNDCFWDVETSGQATSDGGMGLPTAQMRTASTFTSAGWDFVNVWWILEGVGYPRHLWEVPVLHAEPEVTLGTSNTISWDIVPGAMEYYAECAEDANFTSIVYSTGWITETSCEFRGLQLGQRYWYSVKARNAADIESLWSNVESSLQCSLSDAVYLMLDPKNLRSENLKKPYINKINIAQEMIDEGLYKDALNKLQNDILQKTDGCTETGWPDKNDWIINCEQQAVIYPLIIETIEHLKGLME